MTRTRGEAEVVELGSRGASFVKKSFQSGRELAQDLQRTMEFTEGRSFSVFPKGMVPDRSAPFEFSAGLTTDAVLDVTADYLGGVGGTWLVVEDALVQTSDPILAERPERFSINNSLYSYARLPSVAEVRGALQEADSGYALNGVVSAVNGDVVRLPTHRRPASAGSVHSLVRGARLLLARAYDGEGFVFWVPASHPRDASYV